MKNKELKVVDEANAHLEKVALVVEKVSQDTWVKIDCLCWKNC